MEGAKAHWFSILNSLMVITFLAGVVLVILLRIIRRDVSQYKELDEAQTQMNEELSGWKLLVSDVFGAPDHPRLLCVIWLSSSWNGFYHNILRCCWIYVPSFTRSPHLRHAYALLAIGSNCLFCCCLVT